MLELMFRSKIADGSGRLERGIGGHRQAHLDVAVQHRGVGPCASDIHQHRLTAEGTRRDDIGPAIDGLEELTLDLGRRRGAGGLDHQVVTGAGRGKKALVLGHGDRLGRRGSDARYC